MKTRGQLDTEVFEIIKKHGDLRILRECLHKNFKRSKGRLEKLTLKEYEQAIPLIRDAYAKRLSD